MPADYGSDMDYKETHTLFDDIALEMVDAQRLMRAPLLRRCIMACR